MPLWTLAAALPIQRRLWSWPGILGSSLLFVRVCFDVHERVEQEEEREEAIEKKRGEENKREKRGAYLIRICNA